MNKTTFNKNNELIRKRKKAKIRRRIFLFLIFFIGIAVLLSLKTDYFYIKKIVIDNNKSVTAEDIVERSGLTENSNILYINTKNIKNSVATNPYIESVEIKRQLPNTVLINVKEREPKYFINYENNFYILDKSLNILEVRQDSGLNLIEIKGVQTAEKKPGEKAVNSERIIYFTKAFTDLMNKCEKELNISSIDLTDTLNIQLTMKNMTFKIGDEEEIEKKINKIINILDINPSYRDAKGYIDVSFNGNPVIYIEN
ncbi:cell division protein FtsQ/DivIB [Clostridium polynesiense]|uniref:cell division protein FtsQ/DivIB n=1 Tax=Clostridium polynesiense TaxID=1325933 RepID=UPI000590B300|nr:FtsQ-type POTRA domain-containing protein [Clostridium polynesiense]